MTDDLNALLDRDLIRSCLARLAGGEDRRDAELISASYWPDSITDYGVFKGDFTAYLAWVVPGSDAIANTQHVLGQSHIELAGDNGRVETQVISYHRVDYGGGDEHDTCMGGRYIDRVERRDGEWRIALRTNLIEWSTLPLAVPLPFADVPDLYANGAPARDRSDPSYARPLINVRALQTP
jgi:hypothetical protein